MFLRFFPSYDRVGVVLHYPEHFPEGFLLATPDRLYKGEKSSSQDSSDVRVITHTLYQITVRFPGKVKNSSYRYIPGLLKSVHLL